MGQVSSVSKVTVYMELEGQGWIPGKEIFRHGLDLTISLIQWILSGFVDKNVARISEYDADCLRSIYC